MAQLLSNTTIVGKSILDLTWPIGSIYLSMTNTNPGSTLGGTWTQISAGRFLLGAGGGYTAGATGGEASHVLSIAEQPKLTGYLQFRRMGGLNAVDLYSNGSTTSNNVFDLNVPGRGDKWDRQASDVGNSNSNNTNTVIRFYNRGEGKAHNNMPPYLVCYMWQRTK